MIGDISCVPMRVTLVCVSGNLHKALLQTAAPTIAYTYLHSIQNNLCENRTHSIQLMILFFCIDYAIQVCASSDLRVNLSLNDFKIKF